MRDHLENIGRDWWEALGRAVELEREAALRLAIDAGQELDQERARHEKAPPAATRAGQGPGADELPRGGEV